MFFFTTYNARTGALALPFTYACASCGASVAAVVNLEGLGSATKVYGIGPGPDAAKQRAEKDARDRAERAMFYAPCPCCTALQPPALEEHRRAQAKIDRNQRRRLPLALALALATGGVLAVPAVRDLAYSTGLLVGAIGLAVFTAGLVFAVLSLDVVVRRAHFASVWFWCVPFGAPDYRTPPPPPQWVPPPSVAPPLLRQPSSRSRVMGILAACTGTGAALFGFLLWASSMKDVYVLNASLPHEPLTVRVDGVPVGRVEKAAATGDDIAWSRITIRHGGMRDVEITSASGAHWSYLLDPKGAKYAWLLAPEGAKNGLCLVESQHVYSRFPTAASAPPAEDELLDGTDDEPLALSRSYDYLFKQAPQTIQMNSSSPTTATRWELRALDCDKLRKDVLAPFATKRRG
jgi:hypothetical protein